MEPLISVIVPVYKVEQYLNKCVDSVIGQTYKNLEIILVDDGSPDNCGAVCDRYAAEDSRIRVIHKSNAGPGEARNSGMQIATGDYLMFVDSDDYLSPDAVQVLYEKLVADGSDMVIGRYADAYDDGRLDDSYTSWMKNAVYTGREILEQMASEPQLSVGPCAKLYRKELFAHLRYPALVCAEDLWLFPAVVEKCSKISLVDNIVYFYYQRASSIIHVYNERSAKACLEAHLYATQCLLDYGVYPSSAKMYEYALLRALQIADAKAVRELMRSFFNTKTHIKLLVKQKPKIWLIWLSLYLPFVKKAVLLKLKINRKRREKVIN